MMALPLILFEAFMLFLLKKNWRYFVLLFVFLSLVSFSQSQYRSRFREGLRIYRSGFKEEAYRYFRQMQKEHPDSVAIMRILGEIDFNREIWKNAAAWYDKVLKIVNNDIDAHYHKAVCYREMGKYKAFVMRKRDWNQAEEHFKFVLDSLVYYKDVHLQYAILQKYRKDYAAAVDLAEKQLEYEPSPQAAKFVHRFYEAFLYNEGFKKFVKWVKKRQGARSALYLGEAYRFDKQYAKADSIFASLLGDSLLTISRVPVYLVYAKSKVEQEQNDSCQIYFEQALESIRDRIDIQLMFENVKYILSDREYQKFIELENVSARRDFFKKIWVERNPMPAADVNYRLVEHVRRFAYAERNFYYDGFRLQFNNPDRLNFLQFPRVFELNDKFNDKGLIYIRHGEPDDRAFAVNAGPLNESWLYYPRGQLNKKMVFHFWQGETQTGNNWRLVAGIPPYLAESRSSFDPLYSRMMLAEPLEAISLQHQIESQGQEDVKIGMNTDQHKWTKELRTIFFPFYLATFREGVHSTRCELYIALSKKDVLPRGVKHSINDSVTINFAVFDENYNRIEEQLQKLPIQVVADCTKTMGYWPGQLNFTGAPELRLFAVDVRTPDDEAIGGYKFRFHISNYDGDNLKMSGIELAHSIRQQDGDGIFYKHGFRVIPNAAKTFSRKENVNIYFEVYNVPQSTGRPTPFFVEYRVRLLQEKSKGLIQKIARLFSKSQPMTANKIERTTANDVSPEYIALDVSRHAPGVYELEIQVQTADAQDSVSRKIKFELQ